MQSPAACALRNFNHYCIIFAHHIKHYIVCSKYDFPLAPYINYACNICHIKCVIDKENKGIGNQNIRHGYKLRYTSKLVVF